MTAAKGTAAAGTGAATIYRVTTVPGDGIGPEVIAAGRRALEAVGRVFGFGFEIGRAHV